MLHIFKAATSIAAFFLWICSSCTSDHTLHDKELARLTYLAEGLQESANVLQKHCSDSLLSIHAEWCAELAEIDQLMEEQKKSISHLEQKKRTLSKDALEIATADIGYRLDKVDADLRYLAAGMGASMDAGR